MTHDEIMKLEAGRELDKLVAEHVMEWRIYEGAPAPAWMRETENGLEWVGFWPDEPNEEDYGWSFGLLGTAVFMPSTDIAAAWQVVEKLRNDGYSDYHEYGEDKTPWWLFMKPDGHYDYCAEAETDPLAICRAALLAVIDNRP